MSTTRNPDVTGRKRKDEPPKVLGRGCLDVHLSRGRGPVGSQGQNTRVVTHVETCPGIDTWVTDRTVFSPRSPVSGADSWRHTTVDRTGPDVVVDPGGMGRVLRFRRCGGVGVWDPCPRSWSGSWDPPQLGTFCVTKGVVRSLSNSTDSEWAFGERRFFRRV